MYDPEEKGIELVNPEPSVGMEGIPGVEREVAHLRNTYNTEENFTM